MPELQLPAVGDEDAAGDALLDGGWVRARDARAASAGSTFAPITAATSSVPRAAIDSLVARASTASRTVGGSRSGTASDSATRNGLPPVVSSNRRGSRPASAASAPTASAESRRGSSRTTFAVVAMSPASTRIGLVRCAVVAVGHEQHGRNALEPARREPQHVERRPVRPVAILDDDDGRARAATAASSARATADGSAASAIGSPRVAAMSCSGPSGAGTASGSQLPTCTGTSARRRERPDERRLADARLAGKHDGSPPLPRGAKRRLERGQLDFALEERAHAT